MTTSPIHDLRSYVQTFDGALPPEFCAQMISAFHSMPQFQQANGRGHRAGLEGSAWLELNITPHADKAFNGFFYAQIDKYLREYNLPNAHSSAVQTPRSFVIVLLLLEFA